MDYQDFKNAMTLIARLSRIVEEKDPANYDPLPDEFIELVTKYPEHYERFQNENI